MLPRKPPARELSRLRDSGKSGGPFPLPVAGTRRRRTSRDCSRREHHHRRRLRHAAPPCHSFTRLASRHRPSGRRFSSNELHRELQSTPARSLPARAPPLHPWRNELRQSRSVERRLQKSNKPDSLGTTGLPSLQPASDLRNHLNAHNRGPQNSGSVRPTDAAKPPSNSNLFAMPTLIPQLIRAGKHHQNGDRLLELAP